MPGSEPPDWTAAQAKRALADRSISAVELTSAIIARIEHSDGAVNAVCAPDVKRALDAADQADKALASGDDRPLLGVPITIKETLNVAGLPTTYGYPEHRDFIPADDALTVTRARQAGAVILGKVNAPAGGADWQTFNDVYGTTNNPYDLSRTCGGSSGGSAAALAMGFGALSIGSDIAGSLRVPANFCGVFAHKPSVNLVPIRGHTPPKQYPLGGTTDLLVVGPMARCAEDLGLLLDSIAGPDDLDDGIGYQLRLPLHRHAHLRDYRVLILNDHPLVPTDSELRAAIDGLAQKLRGVGATVATQSNLLPDLDAAAKLYVRLLNSTMAVFLPDEVMAQVQAVVAGIDEDNTSFHANYLRGITLRHRDWVIDDAHRKGLRAQWRRFFRDFDAVISPSAPVPAFPHDHKGSIEDRSMTIDGAKHPYRMLMIWPSIATAPGLPATAMPIGTSKNGLPLGVQIMGPYLEDRTTIRLAELIEREFGGFVAARTIAAVGRSDLR